MYTASQSLELMFDDETYQPRIDISCIFNIVCKTCDSPAAPPSVEDLIWLLFRYLF